MAKTRPKWVSWLPATVLAVFIVAALVVGYILVRGGLGSPAPAPTEGQVTDLNWSSFTEDGLEYIERSRDIRIDLSDQGADAVGLGLDTNGTITIGPNPEGLFYEFIFKGGDVGPGGDKLFVNQLTITTTDGEITLITAADHRSRELPRHDQPAHRGVGAVRMGHLDRRRDLRHGRGGHRGRRAVRVHVRAGDRAGTPVSATAQCDPPGTAS